MMTPKTKTAKAADSTKQSTFTEDDKGPHVVIIANLDDKRFDPLTKTIPHCLLPLGDIPLIHFAVSRVIEDGFKDILIYVCNHFNKVKDFVTSSYLRHSNLRISVHNGEGSRSLGDIMRDLDSSQITRGIADFLLIPADLVCAIPLASFFEGHKKRRARNPNAILSLILPHTSGLISRAQAAEWSTTVIFSPSADNRLIKFLQMAIDPPANVPLSELLSPDQSVELSSGMMDVGIYVCSSHIPPLFQDNFDYEDMSDLIRDVLTNEEVMGFTIHIDPLPFGPVVLQAAPDLTSLMHLLPHVLAREAGAASLLPPRLLANSYEFKSVGPKAFAAATALIDPTARVIGTCLIGPGCRIGAGACLIDCALGPDCHVGNAAHLRRVVALEGVEIGDEVVADMAWICEHARLLEGVRLPTFCFVGGSDGVPVTLGPGRGDLPTKSVIVVPDSTDLIIDAEQGGSQVWASFYSRKRHPSRAHSELNKQPQNASEETVSDWDGSSSDMGEGDQSGDSVCRLWETAEDRIRIAIRERRRMRRAVSSTSEAFSSRQVSKSLKRRGRTTSTATESEVDMDQVSEEEEEGEEEGEKSEAFLVEELRRTLEHIDTGTEATENVILEVNALKHAYNVPIDDLYFLVTKAILDLTRSCSGVDSSNPSEPNKDTIRAFVSEFIKQLTRFSGVLKCYMSNSDSAERLCLQALEDTACYSPLVMSASPYLFHALYDKDLVSEGTVWWWVENSPLLADDDLAEHTRSIREKIQPFLSWLKESDEDDDDEESESD